MIRLLLEYPGLARLAPSPEDLKAISAPGFDLFAEIVELSKKNLGTTAGAILESFRGQEAEKHLSSLMRWTPVELSGVKDEEEVHAVFEQGMRRFRLQRVRQQIGVLEAKQAEEETLSQAEQEELANLRKERAELARAPGG